ncbi:hypothetical protein CEXT_55801 [Caerostris extrusa]|uniref:Uncharacterized protein n=1 Tax=Caerostris extrusa TaxID=172846 RepID=A0AAV4VFR4_CAEEX|nr:hypothetical protein CEXT_55801 [Caerostris extrusa]
MFLFQNRLCLQFREEQEVCNNKRSKIRARRHLSQGTDCRSRHSYSELKASPSAVQCHGSERPWTAMFTQRIHWCQRAVTWTDSLLPFCEAGWIHSRPNHSSFFRVYNSFLVSILIPPPTPTPTSNTAFGNWYTGD